MFDENLHRLLILTTSRDHYLLHDIAYRKFYLFSKLTNSAVFGSERF